MWPASMVVETRPCWVPPLSSNWPGVRAHLKKQLLPMPMTFHVMCDGCVLLPASQARQHTSVAVASWRASTVQLQNTQHQ